MQFFLRRIKLKKMNFYDIVSENDTVLHNGVEVPVQITSGTFGRDNPVVERMEVSTFDASGNYTGSIMVYDDSSALEEIKKNGISRIPLLEKYGDADSVPEKN